MSVHGFSTKITFGKTLVIILSTKICCINRKFCLDIFCFSRKTKNIHWRLSVIFSPSLFKTEHARITVMLYFFDSELFQNGDFRFFAIRSTDFFIKRARTDSVVFVSLFISLFVRII